MLPKYTSELTERELALAVMHRNTLFWHLRKEEEMTDKEAYAEIDRINRKVESIESFEVRQIMRAERINQAKMKAAQNGTNQILIRWD